VVAALAALGLAGVAGACVCAAQPLEQRLDDADVAFVGRIESEREATRRGAPERLLTVAVEGTVVVRSPSGSDCDLVVPENRSVGFLLVRAPDGGLLGSLCSMVAPGQLVAEGGEPRGTLIKVALGLLIVGIVLSWALRRRARGTRPDLPDAPRP
jgi:hypothetical protein